MTNKTTIAVIGAVLAICFLYYYFCVDTLSFSELTKGTGTPTVTILTNLFDFDTSLTRWDIYHLNDKSAYWEQKIKQVNSIQNYEQREQAELILFAEMMQDPSIKKITQKTLGFMKGGAKTSMDLMQFVKSII